MNAPSRVPIESASVVSELSSNAQNLDGLPTADNEWLTCAIILRRPVIVPYEGVSDISVREHDDIDAVCGGQSRVFDDPLRCGLS